MARPIYNKPLYQQTRRHWRQLIDAGHPVTCRRCGRPIKPGQQFDLGHPDDATPGGPTTNQALAPEHPACNRTAGARAANHHRAGTVPPSRPW